jgi:hypothetical protein
MSTKPISIILPEAIEPKEYQELLNLISSTLTEIVGYGTHSSSLGCLQPQI